MHHFVPKWCRTYCDRPMVHAMINTVARVVRWRIRPHGQKSRDAFGEMSEWSKEHDWKSCRRF